ncbi:iron-containing alcohol dehydrogenase family protein [Advenella mimigardefordensis]|uniref:Putative iron-containing alcohol dehydrogenase n=1 Tax=Advenella mimigardefordensis (strain DSM 17166 / LMG 22922 / DPN7) TaxID=1247726 RepID=W0PBQ5_ADVMD|nr:iron-containing alcohol dehydrogenase family protein [Advenella mimigardefordensis]AHG64171.1 putative iron-containing alcohol dehydrogenase [Advenella mimigardefordensis DPN7]
MTSGNASFQHISPELRVYSGVDCFDGLKRELARNGCRRAVVVCGRTIASSDTLNLLRSSLGPLFAGVSPTAREQTPLPAVMGTVSALKEFSADSIIAVGGGSAAVTARAAGILFAEPLPVQELCTRRTDDGRFFSPRLKEPKIPQFMVPTTPSTAFVKVGCGVHEEQTGQRYALFDPKTRTKGIFIHPEMLCSAPAQLVRNAALNTFCTAIEALESPRSDPFAQAFLMHAIRLLAENIERLDDPQQGVHENLVLAAILGGRGTEQSGAGLASVLAHAIGYHSRVSNGLVNAIVLPHTMRFNEPLTEYGRSRLAQALSGALPAVSGVFQASATISMVQSLLNSISPVHRLRDIDINQAAFPMIARAAMADWFISRTPRPVEESETLLALLQASW